MQYSKLLPLCTGIIFIYSLFSGLHYDNEISMIDASVIATAITVSGGLCATCCLWYMKKAQAENAFKLKIALYRAASRERFKYNARMIRLRKKYNINQNDIDEIENDSFLDEIENDAFSQASYSADAAMEEGTSSLEMHQF